MTDEVSLGSAIIAPFLVVLRESIEAALIVGIMWAYLDKTNNKEYQRYLAYGTVGAIIMSLVLGGGIVLILGQLAGFWEKMFEGVASISATLVLTYVVIWMAKHAGSMKGLNTIPLHLPVCPFALQWTVTGLWGPHHREHP